MPLTRITNDAIAATAQVNAESLTTGTIPLARLSAANSSANGIVTTSTQSLAGDKTFQNTAAFSNTVSITGAANALSTLGVGGTLSALGQLSVTGNATFDTSTLFVDATNDRVGIGTTSPAYPFDVTKAGGGNFVGYFKNTSNGTPYTLRVQEPASPISGYPLFDVINSAGTNAYFLVHSGTGNIGIGTSSPDAKTTIVGAMYVPAAEFKGVLSLQSTDAQGIGNGAGIMLGGVYNNTGARTTFGQIAGIKENSTNENYAGALAFYSRPNGTTLAERMRIDSSGTVSISNQAYIGGQTINGQSYYQWESATYRNPGDWTARLLIRRDNATTGLINAYPALVLYNDNGADQSTVALAFASAEAVSGTAGRNSVSLAGLIAKKEGAGVAGSWSSGSLTLFTKNGGTQVAGLTVTSSGAVTLGSQPAFGAYKQNTSSGVTGTVTGYEVTKINRGSHFNATNGRFTAPVAGAYYFTFSAFQDTNTSGVMNLQIQVNGADVGVRQYTDDASGLYGPSTTISIVLSLSASDYVTAVVATGTVHGNQNAYFSGYLLG